MDWELLAGLPDETRRTVLKSAVRRRYRKGDTLFFEGEPGDTLHLIASGRVAIRVGSRTGDTATLAVLSPGDCFGEQALLDPKARRTASAVALEPSETLALHRADFDALRRREPAVTDLLVEILARQVRRLSGLVVEAHFMPADQRVVNRLAELAVAYAPLTSIPLTQEDLASLAGTTRPTTNRALQQLVDRGVIELRRGRVEIIDPEMLERSRRR